MGGIHFLLWLVLISMCRWHYWSKQPCQLVTVMKRLLWIWIPHISHLVSSLCLQLKTLHVWTINLGLNPAHGLLWLFESKKGGVTSSMYLVVCKLQHHPFNKEKKNICQFHGITLLSIFNENTRLSSLMRCFSFIITGSPWIIEE